MKVIMYGADTCPDCTAAKNKIASSTDIELDFRDITKSLKTLKEFLSYRDHDELFLPVIKSGGIGIPFIILEDQTRTFEINDLLDGRKDEKTRNTCSLHGDIC
jgi:glutaredoxin-related protein